MVCFSTCYPLLPNRAFKLSESFLNRNSEGKGSSNQKEQSGIQKLLSVVSKLKTYALRGLGCSLLHTCNTELLLYYYYTYPIENRNTKRKHVAVESTHVFTDLMNIKSCLLSSSQILFEARINLLFYKWDGRLCFFVFFWVWAVFFCLCSFLFPFPPAPRLWRQIKQNQAKKNPVPFLIIILKR